MGRPQIRQGPGRVRGHFRLRIINNTSKDLEMRIKTIFRNRVVQ